MAIRLKLYNISKQFGFLLYHSATLLLFSLVILAVVIFSVFYSLAMIGPILGRYFSVDSRVRKVIDVLVGIKDIHSFREDFRAIVANNVDELNSDLTKFELRREIVKSQATAKSDAQNGDFLLAIVSGVLSVVARYFSPISIFAWWIGIYALLTTFAITFRVIIVDILAYGGDDEEEERIDDASKPELIIMEAWNRKILHRNQTQATVLIAGVLKSVSPWGYQSGIEILDEVVDGNRTKFEHMMLIALVMNEEIRYSYWGERGGEETSEQGNSK